MNSFFLLRNSHVLGERVCDHSDNSATSISGTPEIMFHVVSIAEAIPLVVNFFALVDVSIVASMNKSE